MRTGLSSIAMVLVLLFVAGHADAGKFEFAGKATVEVPKGWKTQSDGNVATFTTKDSFLAISLMFEPTDVDSTWNLTVAETQKLISGFTVDKAAGVLGALTGYVGAGKGDMSGTPVEALIAVFPVNGGSMALFALGATGKYEKHEKAMAKFLGSLLPIVSITSDDQFTQIPADGQKAANQIVAAIAKNDSKAFLKFVHKKGIAFADGASAVVVKSSKVKAAAKKAGGVAPFLGLPPIGDFRVLFDAETGTSFSIYRGVQSGVVSYVHVVKDKKKWVIDGQWMQDHGAE